MYFDKIGLNLSVICNFRDCGKNQGTYYITDGQGQPVLQKTTCCQRSMGVSYIMHSIHILCNESNECALWVIDLTPISIVEICYDNRSIIKELDLGQHVSHKQASRKWENLKKKYKVNGLLLM